MSLIYNRIKVLLEEVSDLEKAGDPSSDAQALKELANHADYKIRSKVAENPNTPPETLNDLLPYHLNKVLNNPVLPILKLENPNILGDWAKYTHPDPEIDLDRRTILANSTHPDILHGLATDEQPTEVYEQLLNNEHLPAVSFEILSKHPEQYIKSKVAAHPKTHQSILRRLAKDKNFNVRANVAANKNIPEDLLNKLSFDVDPDVRFHVASNNNTNLTTLQALAKDKISYVNDAAKKFLKQINV